MEKDAEYISSLKSKGTEMNNPRYDGDEKKSIKWYRLQTSLDVMRTR